MIRLTKPTAEIVEIDSNGIKETFLISETTLKCENDIIYISKPGRTYEFRQNMLTKPGLPSGYNLYELLRDTYFDDSKTVLNDLTLAFLELFDTTYLRSTNLVAITPRCKTSLAMSINYSSVKSDSIKTYEMDVLIQFSSSLDADVIIYGGEILGTKTIPEGTDQIYLSSLFETGRKTIEAIAGSTENYAFDFYGINSAINITFSLLANKNGAWGSGDILIKNALTSVSVISIDNMVDSLIEDMTYEISPTTEEIDYNELAPETVTIENTIAFPEEIELPDEYLHDILIEFGESLADALTLVITIDEEDPLASITIPAATSLVYLSDLLEEVREQIAELAGVESVFKFEFSGFVPGSHTITFKSGINVENIFEVQDDILLAQGQIAIKVVFTFADLADLLQADATMTITDEEIAVTDAEPAELSVGLTFPEFAGVQSDVTYDVKIDFGGALANNIEITVGENEPVEVVLGETSVLMSTLLGITPESVSSLSEVIKTYALSITGLAIAVHTLTITAEITQDATTEVVQTVETEITVTSAE